MSGRPPLDLGSMGGSIEELKERMEILTRVFGTLMDMDLELRNGMSGHTDCKTFVATPMHDPEAYLILEHELSHPFCGTDLALTEQFVSIIVEKLLKSAGLLSSQPEAAPYKQKLKALVHHLWNVLEDWRCCSIWGELYPGGAALLTQRWKDIAKHEMGPAAKRDLIAYLARTAAGVDTDEAPDEFKVCRKHMLRARKQVELVDNKACLAITSRLIEDIADDLLKKYPPPPQNGSKSRQKKQLHKLAQLTKLVNPPAPGVPTGESNVLGEEDLMHPKGADGREKKKRPKGGDIQAIKKLSKIKDDKELEKLMEEGTKKMFQRLEDARRKLGEARKGERSGEKEFLVASAKAVGIQGVMVTPSQKLPRPSRGAAKMRKHLERVRMQKELRRAWHGSEIDVGALIAAKISQQISSTKLFKEEVRNEGMDLLLLLDVSGSMQGWGLDVVDQAVADVEFACRGLEVNLKLWGFSSQLYFFSKVGSVKRVKGLTMSMTHTVQALDAAWEWARASKRTRAIMMVTDGLPTTRRARKSSGDSIQDMNAVLKEMRQGGIVVSVLGIGQSENYYDQAFGKGKYGHVVGLGDLPKALSDSARVIIEAHLGQ